MELMVFPTDTWLSSYGYFQFASQIQWGILDELHPRKKTKTKQWNECSNLLQVCFGNANMTKIPTLLFGKGLKNLLFNEKIALHVTKQYLLWKIIKIENGQSMDLW